MPSHTGGSEKNAMSSGLSVTVADDLEFRWVGAEERRCTSGAISKTARQRIWDSSPLVGF